MNSLLKLTPEELGGILLENQQQARLLGMSAERECALRGKVDRLERELTQQAAQFHADIKEQPWLAEIRGYSQRVATLTAELATEREKVRVLQEAMKFSANNDKYFQAQFDPCQRASAALTATEGTK